MFIAGSNRQLYNYRLKRSIYFYSITQKNCKASFIKLHKMKKQENDRDCIITRTVRFEKCLIPCKEPFITVWVQFPV